MKNLFFRSITVVILSLFVISCGNSPTKVLSDVKVSSQNIEDDVWISFEAELDLGAMRFASISIPIIHPRGQTPIGQLDLMNGLNKKNYLKIEMNVSELTDIQAQQASLPNGSMVPLLTNNEVITVNIAKGARVYIAVSEGITAIGVAVPIEAFDSIGNRLPGLNFFPVVSAGNVIGTAGIFTSKNKGQNGLAVVADISNLLDLNDLLKEAPVMMAVESQLRSSDLSLDYRTQNVSAPRQQSLQKMILDLNRKRAVLRIR